jgi:drug/metabolite transporter (DMT)-like permease
LEDHRKAVTFALFAAASLAAMAAFAKLAVGAGLFERVLGRNLVMLLVASFVLARRRGRPFGSPGNRGRLLMRALLGLGGVTCYFFAIDHLLLADAAMLNKLSPFVALVAAWALLGERPAPRTIGAVALAFCGALLVMKPRLDLSMVPALAGFGSAMFAGCAYTVVRSLRDRERPDTIIFVFSLVTVVVLAPQVAIGFRGISAVNVGWIVLIGVSAAAGQFSLTHAFRHGPAAEVALYSYTTIVFSALAGFLVWGEVPDLLSMLGAAAILGAAIVVYGVARERSESGARGLAEG